MPPLLTQKKSLTPPPPRPLRSPIFTNTDGALAFITDSTAKFPGGFVPSGSNDANTLLAGGALFFIASGFAFFHLIAQLAKYFNIACIPHTRFVTLLSTLLVLMFSIAAVIICGVASQNVRNSNRLLNAGVAQWSASWTFGAGLGVASVVVDAFGALVAFRRYAAEVRNEAALKQIEQPSGGAV